MTYRVIQFKCSRTNCVSCIARPFVINRDFDFLVQRTNRQALTLYTNEYIFCGERLFYLSCPSGPRISYLGSVWSVQAVAMTVCTKVNRDFYFHSTRISAPCNSYHPCVWLYRTGLFLRCWTNVSKLINDIHTFRCSWFLPLENTHFNITVSCFHW